MTWLQTASGRAFDLLHPDWRQVDFDTDIAEALARIARFTGHVRSGPYSVAQHCVIGADAIFRAGRDREAAAAFLLHDAHEAYLGDIATPIGKALADRVRFLEGHILGDIVSKSLASLKSTIDREIYRAAGMGLNGCPEALREIVKTYDVRMLVTERAHLLGPSPKPWGAPYDTAEPLRLIGRITPWPWHLAADEYRDRLRKYLPDRFGGVTANPPSKSGPRRDGARPVRKLEEA